MKKAVILGLFLVFGAFLSTYTFDAYVAETVPISPNSAGITKI